MKALIQNIVYRAIGSIDFIAASIAFYLSHSFKFKLSNDRQYIEIMLRILDSATLEDYIKLNSVFSNEKEYVIIIKNIFMIKIFLLFIYYSVSLTKF